MISDYYQDPCLNMADIWSHCSETDWHPYNFQCLSVDMDLRRLLILDQWIVCHQVILALAEEPLNSCISTVFFAGLSFVLQIPWVISILNFSLLETESTYTMIIICSSSAEPSKLILRQPNSSVSTNLPYLRPQNSKLSSNLTEACKINFAF